MSSKEEKIRQKLMEERQRQEALGREIEQTRLDEEKRMAAALIDDDELKPLPTDKITLCNVQTTDPESDDWKKITADFIEKYPNTPIENNTLRFPNIDDAIAFFENQAAFNPPREFLVREIGPKGKPTGYHVFSCGDGKLYKGTLEELQEQLKTAQLANADDPKIKQGLQTIAKFLNPAQDYKDSLLKTKDPEAASNSSLPSPLSTRPKTTP